MRGFALLVALHFGGDEHPAGDRWFAADKAKHFFAAAFVQSASFSMLRTTGLSRSVSLAGATFVTGTISVGKELYDRTSGGTPSFRDLTWDAAGAAAASTLLLRTQR